MTNRELFFDFKKEQKDEFINDTIIYNILIDANGFLSFSELVINFDNECKNEIRAINSFSRVNNGEELYYVLGYIDIDDTRLKLNKNVLIPRPETIELCDIVCEELKHNNFSRGNIYDVCTGSGLIAILLKKKFQDSEVYASDISKEAIDLSTLNAKENNLNINFYVGDKLEPMLSRNIKIDVLISNPPYINSIDEIEENVLKNEPFLALYSLDDIYFYKYYLNNFRKIMNKKFYMAFEINYNQEERLTNLIKEHLSNDKIEYRFIKDQFNKTRFLIIKGEMNENNSN